MKNYSPATDQVAPLRKVRIRLDAKALGIGYSVRCRMLAPDSAPVALDFVDGRVEVPNLGLWCILHFE